MAARYALREASDTTSESSRRPLRRTTTVSGWCVQGSAWAPSPRVVDALFSGASLAAAAAALRAIDLAMGAERRLPLMAPPLLGSAMLFFAGPTPPPPKPFLLCTLASWAAGLAFSWRTMWDVHAGDTLLEAALAVGVLTVVFKLCSSFFVPTVGLAALLLTDETGAYATLASALHFLAAPWLAGNARLYAAAFAAARGRRAVRASLTRSRLRALIRQNSNEVDDEHLLRLFRRFDTSGDGFLQPGELKYAWQAAMGEEMSAEDALNLVRSIDTDGNGEIDSDEFIALVHDRL